MKKCTNCLAEFEVTFKCETPSNSILYCPKCGHYCGFDLNTLHLHVDGYKSRYESSFPCELIFKINDFGQTNENGLICADFCVKQGDDILFKIDKGMFATYVDLRNMKAKLSNHLALYQHGEQFPFFGGRVLATFEYYSQPEDRDEFIYVDIALLSKDNIPLFELSLHKYGTESLLSFLECIIE